MTIDTRQNAHVRQLTIAIAKAIKFIESLPIQTDECKRILEILINSIDQ